MGKGGGGLGTWGVELVQGVWVGGGDEGTGHRGYSLWGVFD